MDLFSSPTRLDLHCGDCLVGLREHVADASVDLVVTSPPYNIGVTYGAYSDTSGRTDYLAWCDEWMEEISRVLHPNGSFFLNLGGSPKNPWLPHELVLRARGKFALQNTIHWIKSISVETGGTVLSKGHFKPIQSQRFVNDCHEYLFHLTKAGSTPIHRKAIGVPYADKSNIERWGHTEGQNVRCRGNTWFVPYETITRRSKDRPHPATFPTALVVNCIRLHGANAQSTMLDPFLGIGTSAIAAQQCEVGRFIGFEIDPTYFDHAKSRIHGDH